MANDPNEQARRKKPASLQSSNQPKSRKYDFMKKASRTTQKEFRMDDLDATVVRDAITAVIESGDLISFTLTSDGGALTISVITNGERFKQYATTKEDAEDLLQALTV